MNFTIIQRDYGGQDIYFKFGGKSYYLDKVSPNFKDYFGITHINDCIFNPKTLKYTDHSGNETIPYTDLEEFLFQRYKEKICRIIAKHNHSFNEDSLRNFKFTKLPDRYIV